VAAALLLSGCRVVAPPRLPGGGGPSFATPAGSLRADLAYGARAVQMLDLYLPDPVAFPGPRPVIVWLHAGGWAHGSRQDPAPIAMREVGRGYAVASVEYGLAPQFRFPQPVYDVKQAIRWLRVNAPGLGLDASVVLIAGYSAGAQLAAFVAVTPGEYQPPDLPAELVGIDDAVLGVVAISAGVDFEVMTRSTNAWTRLAASDFLGCTGELISQTPLDCAPGVAKEASVATHVSAASPPAFFVHGADDALFPPEQIVRLVRAWEDATNRPESLWGQVVPNNGHGIDPDDVDLRALDDFLDACGSGALR
jgi:acetyl esterase/lipase